MIFLYSIIEEHRKAVVLVAISVVGVFLAYFIEKYIESNGPQPPTDSESGSDISQGIEDVTDGEFESKDTAQLITPTPAISDPQTTDLLVDLEPYHETYGIYYDTNCKDVYKNEFRTALIGFENPSSGKQYWAYDLGQKYDTVSFTTFVSCNTDAKEEYNAFIYIYGDDNCIYENESINCFYHPENVILDIHEYNDLRIELYGQGFEYAGSYGVSAGIGNVTLTSSN